MTSHLSGGVTANRKPSNSRDYELDQSAGGTSERSIGFTEFLVYDFCFSGVHSLVVFSNSLYSVIHRLFSKVMIEGVIA